MLEGYKLITRVAKTPPFSDYLTESEDPKHADNLSDEQIKDHIRKSQLIPVSCIHSRRSLISHKAVETIYHPMCTCKIGQLSLRTTSDFESSCSIRSQR